MAEFTRWEIYMLLNQKDSGLWLAHIDLSSTNLIEANLSGANLSEAKPSGYNLHLTTMPDGTAHE